jgi:cob(I)alamin adenosyltransferase
MKKGLTHIYYGDGKGKTTACIGLIVRALSKENKILLVQFMKKPQDQFSQFGEIKFLKDQENIEIKQFGDKDWVMEKPSQKALSEINNALNFLKEKTKSEKFDLVVADEILYALQMGLIKEDDVKDLILEKPEEVELVLTGSHKKFLCFELADYVTEIKKHKHPFDAGILAREGIEY